MSEKEERDILEGLLHEGKREAAFEGLVRTYQERLYWHIRKIVLDHEDADDVLQNTFLKTWKSLDHFRADSSLFTWLYRIATNEALTFLKQKKRRSFISWGDEEEKMGEALSSDPWFDGDELQLKLQKAIARLPDKQRLVFQMKYFDDMKYEEMSEILGTSVGALKASYHHAVKKIESTLKDN
ncbi:MAG: sigma-70 family RNA polymerase sigma factor [Bacteroidales bacterium]